MSGPGVWTSPSPAPRAGRRSSRASAVVAGLAGAAVLVSGLLVARDGLRPGADDPEAALESWLEAAQAGDLAALREAVAPSQRDALDPADPAGVRLGGLRVERVSLGRPQPSGLSPDEALVDNVAGVVCEPGAPPAGSGRDDRLQCLDVVGSGPGGAALAVREQGRWWAVAAPFRLVERVRSPG